MDQRIVDLGDAIARAANKALEESDEVANAYAKCLGEGYGIVLNLTMTFARVNDTPEKPAKPEKPVVNTDIEWLDKLHKLEDNR